MYKIALEGEELKREAARGEGGGGQEGANGTAKQATDDDNVAKKKPGAVAVPGPSGKGDAKVASKEKRSSDLALAPGREKQKGDDDSKKPSARANTHLSLAPGNEAEESKPGAKSMSGGSQDPSAVKSNRARRSLAREEEDNLSQSTVSSESQPDATRISGIDGVDETSVGGPSVDGETLLEAELVIDRGEDEDIEAKVQERLVDKEEEIKQKIFSQAAQAEDVKVVTSSEGEDANPKKHWMWILAAAVILIVVLAVAIPLSRKDDPDEDEDISIDPPEAPEEEVELTYEEELLELLSPLYSEEELEELVQPDGTSPQHQAYQWIVHNDTLYRNVTEDEKPLISERYALVALYFSTAGAGWFDQAGFLDREEPVCEWNNRQVQEGANTTSDDTAINGTVDEAGEAVVDSRNTLGVAECTSDNKVMRLRLDNNFLMGTIPSELSFLKSVRTLHMALNDLYGPIPGEIGTKLKDLESLQLNTNSLTGKLPLSLGDLEELTNLSLFHNLLTGALPSQITMLNKLRYLNIFNNNLEGTIPDFRLRSDIEQIIMGANYFTGTIPESIYANARLIDLLLNQNQLTGTISTLLGDLTRLESLWLFDNILSGTIPSQIGMGKDISDLRLFENQLTGSLPTELGELGELRLMDLHDNRLGGQLADEIFESLTELHTLYLHINEFVGTVPQTFQTLADNSLITLTLHNTSITGDLDELLCVSERASIFDLSADCGGIMPEVNCTECCLECCDDIEGCPEQTGFTACEKDRSQISASYCQCLPDNGYGDGWYELSCHFSFAQYCNALGEDCTLYTYGWIYDQSGATRNFHELFEYVSGPYEGRSVSFSEIYVLKTEVYDCMAEIDGQECDACTRIECSDFFQTYNFRCTDGQEDFTFGGCTDETSGVLQVFHRSYDLRNYFFYNPGICEIFLNSLEADVEALACGCDDEGLELKCIEQNCTYCVEGSGLDEEGPPSLCFWSGITFELEYRSTGILSNSLDFHFMSADVYDGTVLSFNNSAALVDGTCDVVINEEECQSCMIVDCVNGTQALAVDCTNLSGFASSTLDGCDESTWTESGILRVLAPDVFSWEEPKSLGLNCTENE